MKAASFFSYLFIRTSCYTDRYSRILCNLRPALNFVLCIPLRGKFLHSNMYALVVSFIQKVKLLG